MRYLPLGALLILAACSKAPQPAAPSAGAAPVLSFEGYGPVHFGAQLPDVEQKLGAKSVALGANDPACSMVRFPGIQGVRFMVEQGKITRADADAGVANSLGIASGDTLDAAKKKAPALAVGPHKYLPEGHYLTASSGDGKAAIIMEEDGKAITKIRAGMQPAVAYVETCL
ncbi:hypothetical protein [Pseudoduganella aquatica]|uniref:Uncharacterized protein n=1 Tax=Pseudoduganella aquatica TaxID=2660641 RepID=A0A7X4KL49_9BURK|nr:hypothetical protein [Pseudoduganella aquatica]MYN06718.1 hypothetical protein [Pseudoduganella aquatica]